ncbi:MAG: DEAD/DEAH box helicase family protein [Candidatus Pacebacteria bacterium]|nr:DEAD/DEAH box helicase family protein [Candidatus Paceibacterota bacterium]
MAELHEQIKNAIEFGTPKPEIPEYISNNLKYPFFDWQKEAFQYLLLNEKKTEGKNESTHLMFNMATGTGKTLVMASCILHYYKKGYRKFIFFVNQKNIIYKTENNFIDSTHNKYLFADKIVIDNETINIKKVETFSKSNEGIEIKLTTIQQLYNDIHIQKENQVLLDDLIKKDIVMLADEAHHLNTDTKKLQGELDLHTELKESAKAEEIEKKGWEHTVIELLLNKNGKKEDNKNVLLEFTATIPEIQKIIDKYADKTIYKFGLKEFLSAGYTKEINLLSSTLDKRERILQALLFSWYRHKIALKNDLSNWKPVILFRSKTIEESKTDFEEFLVMVKNLEVSDFDFLKNIEERFTQGEDAYEQGKSRVLDLINFIKNEGINRSEIITFIKDNFSERNCIITNSKTNKTKKEKIDEDTDKLLNNLEDKDNHIRAIFTVNRLTEGWDVLNLFDIVRLYEGRIDSEGREGARVFTSTAISEIQLIGRGVRYYPFPYQDKIKNKRKFDNLLNNEMRVLEELYYHSDSDHRYISDLKSQLKEKGFIQDNRIEKRFKIKPDFAKGDFFKGVKIWKNEKIDNPERQQKKIDYLRENLELKFDLASLGILEEEIDFNKEDSDTERLNINDVNKKTITKSIKEFEKHIFDKAINIKSKKQNSLLRFESLQQEIDIESMEDFRTKLIGDLKIKLVTVKSSFDEITNKEKLEVLLKALDMIFAELKKHINPHKGTEFEAYSLANFFSEEVRKNVKRDEHSQRLEDELKYEDWYVVDQFYGTSEEKGLIEFIKDTIINLQNKYKEVYLLRNEEQYKIFDFNTGQGFQPDFILFLKDRANLHYQVFVEPKGDNLLQKDEWKNLFLKEITEKYSKKKVLKIEGKEYNLIGLPLFNEKNKDEFEEEYIKLI